MASQGFLLTPEAFQQIILPSIIAFILIFEILSKLKIFGSKTNIGVSVAISLMIVSSPQYSIFSAYIIEMGGYAMLGVFAIIFIVGVFLWSVRTSQDIHEETGPSRREKRVLKQIQKVDNKLRRAKGAKQARLLEERRLLEQELVIARARKRR